MTLTETAYAKINLALLVAASVGGCASAERKQTEQEALAERIESRIELPGDALPLERYGRNYALKEDGSVVAVYVGSHRPSDARVGESRWHKSVDDLPMVMDGGCSVITVKYDPKSDHLSAHCNGVA